MITSSKGRRVLKIVGLVGVVVLGGALIADRMQLAHLVRATQTYAKSTDIRHIQTTITQLQAELDGFRRQPASVARTEFDAARNAYDERLGAVEHAAQAAASADALTALDTRVRQLETHTASVPHAATPHRTTTRHPSPATPAPPMPPFVIRGVEQRGGVSFLTVSPPHLYALGDVHLLATGENEGDWQLEALDAHTATFRVSGQRVNLPIR
ncbi:Uncharacterised protein [Burkholderia pseudomallei]|uniref:hypothetical protein n=1 Tax=Burkholderia pseudomallei TaxID=28450 RepID=UPI0005E14C25|nr:hypothetical protein [Burkholderia pseudomallei]CAK1327484.1 Uncharacterised protein [Burkholderia pseudomallei]CAK1338863.1 Uncharacterised protein [Burkholderia pseudomallei]